MSDLVKKSEANAASDGNKGSSLAPKGRGGSIKNKRTTAPPPKQIPVVEVDQEDVEETAESLVLENVAENIATIEEFKGTRTYANALTNRAIPNFLGNVSQINNQAHNLVMGVIEAQYGISMEEIYGVTPSEED